MLWHSGIEWNSKTLKLLKKGKCWNPCETTVIPPGLHAPVSCPPFDCSQALATASNKQNTAKMIDGCSSHLLPNVTSVLLAVTRYPWLSCLLALRKARCRVGEMCEEVNWGRTLANSHWGTKSSNQKPGRNWILPVAMWVSLKVGLFPFGLWDKLQPCHVDIKACERPCTEPFS